MKGYSRRDFMAASAAIAVSALNPATGFASEAAVATPNASNAEAAGEGTELQRGDPEIADETLFFNPIGVQELVWGEKKAAFQPRILQFQDDLVNAASDYLGMTRAANRADIAKMLGLFDLSFADANGKPLPFCAAGLSYVATRMYAKQSGIADYSASSLQNYLGDIDRYHFYPSPSVADMQYVAMGKRRWLSRESAIARKIQPKPGWLVIFNWDRKGVPDHVGLLEKVSGNVLKTIEFNTAATIDGNQVNGGAIARRERPYDDRVQGFIQTELKRIV